jgi:hypothetical protein
MQQVELDSIRAWLTNGVTAFFISNLAIFFIFGRLGVEL